MGTDFNPAKIKLVIGLGNPDKSYENTYHNAGFLFIEYLKEKKPAISNFQFLISKSNAFMNASGGFVKKALKKNGLKPEALLLAHDDSDLNLGNFKFSFGRGSAGHKGVESVVKAIGSKNFWRLRIGIRPISPIGPIKRTKADLPAEARRAKAGAFVLKRISAKDKGVLEKVFETISARNLR